MSHCDPETLALRSLGEGVGTPDEDAHLASCEQCRSELENLRRVVTVAKSGGSTTLLAPPEHVWQRITAELSAPSPAVDNDRDRDQAVTEEPSTVVPLRPRRSRPATWLLVAAGVGGVVVGGVATAALMSGSSTTPPGTLEASTALDPLPDWDATGEAALSVNAAGEQVLTVTVDAPTSGADGFREVWLIDSAVQGMVSLGPLEGSTGQFVIPAGVDVGQFPIVDVSLEPVDGVPTHSGNSIVRGTLDA